MMDRNEIEELIKYLDESTVDFEGSPKGASDQPRDGTLSCFLIKQVSDALRTLLNERRWFEADKWPEGIEDERKSWLVFCPEILCTFSAIWRDGGFNYFSNCGGRIGPRVSHYCNLPRNPEGAPTTLFAESVDEAS
jgi:hypothetical protein